MEDRRFVYWTIAAIIAGILSIPLFSFVSFLITYQLDRPPIDHAAENRLVFSNPVIWLILVGMLALFAVSLTKYQGGAKGGNRRSFCYSPACVDNSGALQRNVFFVLPLTA